MIDKTEKHLSRIPIADKKNSIMPIEQFRKKYKKQGFHLVDVTQLCKFKLGMSGWCNDFNCPDEQIYHIKCLYRDYEICSFPDPNKNVDNNFIIFETNKDDITGMDFIIFMKVKQ